MLSVFFFLNDFLHVFVIEDKVNFALEYLCIDR